MNEQIDASQNDQAKEDAHVELQSSPKAPVSAELLFGCSTGDYHSKLEEPQILPPTAPKHSHGLGSIKDEFTGMSTPLSVVMEYRPQQ